MARPPAPRPRSCVRIRASPQGIHRPIGTLRRPGPGPERGGEPEIGPSPPGCIHNRLFIPGCRLGERPEGLVASPPQLFEDAVPGGGPPEDVDPGPGVGVPYQSHRNIHEPAADVDPAGVAAEDLIECQEGPYPCPWIRALPVE